MFKKLSFTEESWILLFRQSPRRIRWLWSVSRPLNLTRCPNCLDFFWLEVLILHVESNSLGGEYKSLDSPKEGHPELDSSDKLTFSSADIYTSPGNVDVPDPEQPNLDRKVVPCSMFSKLSLHFVVVFEGWPISAGE